MAVGTAVVQVVKCVRVFLLRTGIPGSLNQAGERGQMLLWVQASFPEVMGIGAVWEARERWYWRSSEPHAHSLVQGCLCAPQKKEKKKEKKAKWS